jgi:hypothetical protein
VVRIVEHAGLEAVRSDIANFLSGHVRADGTYAISNPFRYAVSSPITAPVTAPVAREQAEPTVPA